MRFSELGGKEVGYENSVTGGYSGWQESVVFSATSIQIIAL